MMLTLVLNMPVVLSLGRFDVNVWIVGAILLLVSIYLFVYLNKTLGKLRKLSLAQSYIGTDNVQFDMILKAMKLSIWSVNAKTKKITYGDDYRDHVDNFIPEENTQYDTTLELIYPEDSKRVEASLSALCNGISDLYHEQYRVMIPQSKGKFYWAESYATVSERDESGNPQTIVGTTMRIDERKKMESALVVERNKAEESNRLKSLFLANINHEIRTPLNSMSGYAQVLLNYNISEEERKKCLERIINNSEILTNLLSTMMELSNTEAGKNSMCKEPMDVNLLLTSLVENYSGANVNGNIIIRSSIPLEKCTIISDRNTIRSICVHLIDNALKFTTSGSVVIGYDKKSEDVIRVWVKDTGCGISDDNQSRIFDSFVKLDEFAQGAGLGLAVCKNFVYNLGGNIGVDSHIGVGSTFWFDIPVK